MAERFRQRTVQAASTGLLELLRSVAYLGDQIGATVHHGLRGTPIEAALQSFSEALEGFRQDQERKLDEVRQDPLYFVVADLPASLARTLLLEAPDGIPVLIKERVMDDPDFVDAVEQAVLDAPHLNGPQRDDLVKGLQAIRVGDSFACRHLLAGVEGGLWLAAEDEGVIDGSRKLLRSPRRREPLALSVTRLLDTDNGGLDIGNDYSYFVRRVVFDSCGHDIRHGRARTGHAMYSVWGFVALLGWLDCFAQTAFMLDVTDRLMVSGEIGVVSREA